MIVMTELKYQLIHYPCEDGRCLMIREETHDSKIGALTKDHESVAEAIVKELNKLAEELHTEQLRTTPITLDTHISDEDFEKLKGMIANAFDAHDKLAEENQQLKKDIDYYKTERAALFEYLDKKDNLKLELRGDKK